MCTNRVADRLDALARGELIELARGETRTSDLEPGALENEAAIARVAARVAALTTGTEP